MRAEEHRAGGATSCASRTVAKRNRATAVRLATITALSTACASAWSRRSPLETFFDGAQRRPESVLVTLADGTRFTLDAPHILNGDLAGRVRACEGPACARVRAYESVGPTAVQAIEEREPDIDPAPVSWPRVGGGVGTSLQYLITPAFTAVGLGLYGRVAARIRRAFAVELEFSACTALWSSIFRGALTGVVTPLSWLSVATGLSVQRAESSDGDFFHPHTDASLVYAVPLEVRTHWLGSPFNGTGHGIEFTLGADLGVATPRSDGPTLAIGVHISLGYGWR